ncbi:kelch repeat and K+ channel tetramerization domain containing protein [Cardiosporidium cionae]|uniref:Kelch repeat and K+ channel tetramerization domain containing protein n=1 Tax=Cardiosporidium cionae TaxID=476202 RepID=A0ABQ7JFM5_9APIC|nr:kelch repeat and K+ channel tetramerization domain containing protein [Cardiosporidium cionae]|eukprot:KAF8822826.1 kelch repeat and K+ channel tetramerization domain containing protein [Cardiosporidium cionae]
MEMEDFCTPEEFENMVGDLRRTFMGWLKKTEATLRRERENLKQKIKEFEEQKTKTWKQIQIEKQFEMDKLKEERRKFDAETVAQIKQIQIERDDSLQKLSESKGKFETEKEFFKRKLAIERQRFQQECEQYDRERQTIVDSNIATETMVEINVGGVSFETSRSTLSQQPGSLLEGILSGRYNITRDKQGAIFFDRDSESFRTILNFLRNPTNPPLPRDGEESDALAREAEFYGLKFFPFPLVFACGGHSGVEHLRSVEVLDIAQQLWRPCKAMTTERAYFGATSLRGHLHVFGGQNLEYKALCEMEVYDCLRDCWVTGPSLNIPRRNNCGSVLGERLFSIGGFDGLNMLASVETYDYRMKNWMEIPPMTTARSAAMCCVQDERLYVFGGSKGDRLRSVEIYDPRANKWDEAPLSLIEIRSAGAAVSVQSYIFVMGGTDNTHSILDSCEVLTKDSSTWTFVKSMSEPRMDFSAAVVSDSIVISGGQNLEVLNSTEFYRPDENEWQSGPPMFFPRYGHSLLLAAL